MTAGPACRLPADTSTPDQAGSARVTCAARGYPTLALDEALVLAVRDRIDTLTAQWNELTAGGALQRVPCACG